MFHGVSAFPLTPLRADRVDTDALGRIVDRLSAAGVESIGALGSTGAAPLLSRDERAIALRTVVEHAAGTPVIAGVSALRTRDVLDLAHDAQDIGADALLLAPMGYQPLVAEEVVGLFDAVLAAVDLPVIIYDNPRTTRFDFTPELYGRIAAGGGVAAIKAPGVLADLPGLRASLPPGTAVGVSGDGSGAAGLAAGCDLWFSSIAGILPEPVLAVARDTDPRARSAELAPLWSLIAEHGGLRVSAAVARLLGLVGDDCLPAPLRVPADPRIASTVRALGLVVD